MMCLVAGVVSMTAIGTNGQEETGQLGYPLAIGTINGDNLNVRGRPSFAGVPIGKLKKGEKVQIYEVYTRTMAKEGEPSKWLKIKLPSDIPVWISRNFFDPTSNQVTASKLNFRSGPGFEYGVLGTLTRGASIFPTEISGDWVKLEAPSHGVGFIAADFVEYTIQGSKVSTSQSVAPTKTTISNQLVDPKTLFETLDAQEQSGAVIENTIKVVVPETEETTIIKNESELGFYPNGPSGDVTGDQIETTQVIKTEEPVYQAPPVTDIRSEGVTIEEYTPVLESTGSEIVSPESIEINYGDPTDPDVLVGESEVSTIIPDRVVVRTESPTPTDRVYIQDTPAVVTPAPQRPTTDYFQAYNLANARSVIREGIVKGTLSARAPTAQSLMSARNKRVMNFLWAPKYQKGLKNLVGRRVMIQGREILDRRWPKTPVLFIEKIRLYPN